jgi:PHD-finger
VSFLDKGCVLGTVTAVIREDDGERAPVASAKKTVKTSPVAESAMVGGNTSLSDRHKPRVKLLAPTPPAEQPIDWSDWDYALKEDTVASVQVSFRENGHIATFCNAKIPQTFLTDMIHRRAAGPSRKIVLPRSLLKVSSPTPSGDGQDRREPVKLRVSRATVRVNGASGHGTDDQSQLHCVCQQPEDPDEFYLQCDACNGWFHPECLGYTAAEVCAVHLV